MKTVAIAGNSHPSYITLYNNSTDRNPHSSSRGCALRGPGIPLGFQGEVVNKTAAAKEPGQLVLLFFGGQKAYL